jgi:ankyrin repeat protein
MNEGSTKRAKTGLCVAGLAISFAALWPGILSGATGGSDDPLITAVKDGLQQEVKALLGKHANVNAVDANGATALAWAAMRDNIPVATLLLKAEADPNLADMNAITPLRVAIDNRSPSMTKLLLENGANPNLDGAQGETPLMVAVHYGSTEIAQLLLQHNADPNSREKQFGQTALMWATRDSELVRLLLASGADVHPITRAWEITSPIYTPPTHTLGVTGIPWNHEGEFTVKAGGLNALMFAVQHENIEAVRMLLDAGLDINQASADGTTPLLASLYNWQLAGTANLLAGAAGMRFSPNLIIAALLLDRGAIVKVANGSGYTPLHALMLSMRPSAASHDAGAAEQFQLAKRMLETGADPNLGTVYPTAGPVSSVRINPLPQGSTPYHAAALVPDAALVELMASFGANPNILRKDGHTPFTVAIMADNLAAVRAMVARGADLGMIYNPADKLADPVEPKAEVRLNQNALHIAAAAGASQVAEFLAEQGVSLQAKNDHGETPLQLANDQEIFRYKAQKEGPVGIGNANAVRSTATSDVIRKALANETR